MSQVNIWRDGKVVHVEKSAESNVKKQILMLPKRILF